MDEKKYSQLYQALLQEVLQFHNGNQRRIRKGMLSLLLVPLDPAIWSTMTTTTMALPTSPKETVRE